MFPTQTTTYKVLDTGEVEITTTMVRVVSAQQFKQEVAFKQAQVDKMAVEVSDAKDTAVVVEAKVSELQAIQNKIEK